MENNNGNVMSFYGEVAFKTPLSLEETGEIISTTILGGAKLGGKEEAIYDEVPAIFTLILGTRIILHAGNSNSRNENIFILSIEPFNSLKAYTNRIYLNKYLALICKEKLQNIDDIDVIEMSE